MDDVKWAYTSDFYLVSLEKYTSNYPINYYTYPFNEIHAIRNKHVYSIGLSDN